MSSKYAIGIDLGTTYSCAAVWRNGKIEIITNSFGDHTTRSAVSIINNEVIVGKTALEKAAKTPDNVFYETKRLIGRSYVDKSVQKILKHLPFDVATRGDKIIVTNDNGIYTPEEIGAYILATIKQNADDYLDCDVTKAVITVPTYFSNRQRQATIDAGKIAGFIDVVLIDEPTAASIEYGIKEKINDARVILIFDFGGGTFDVSIIKYSNNIFEVVAIDGDPNLGGANIDNLITDFIIKRINKKNPTPRDLCRLRKISESIKLELSQMQVSNPDLDLFGFDGEMNFTRKEFDQLCKEIYDKLMEILKNCLKVIEEKDLKVDDILLIGGSTRIPKIAELIEKEIGKKCKRSINPDEAVASGAALYAAKLFMSEFKQFRISTIFPYNLGVEIVGGKMHTLIEKYSKLPARGSQRFKTVNEDDNEIEVKIFSGDNEYTKFNTFLAEMIVSNIASAPEGNILEETFEVDLNGILKVFAVDTSGRSKNLEIQLNKGNLSEKEITEMKNSLRKNLKKK